MPRIMPNSLLWLCARQIKFIYYASIKRKVNLPLLILHRAVDAQIKAKER